eukprot:COSAG02_NODE_2634_length_8374_cov_12.795166_7_plen_172_part_00
MPKKKKAAGKSKEDKKIDAEMMAKAQAIAKENDAKAAIAAEAKAAADAAEAAELMAKYAELGLQESDIMEYREMFSLVDADGGGSIGREEVLDLMRMVGYQCTEEEVDDMISEIDTDGNMEIDFDGATCLRCLCNGGAVSSLRLLTAVSRYAALRRVRYYDVAQARCAAPP